jgi:hypothetical protein
MLRCNTSLSTATGQRPERVTLLAAHGAARRPSAPHLEPTMTSPGSTPSPSWLQRLPLAFGAFFGVLGDAALAARFAALRSGAATAPAAAPVAPPPAPPAALKETAPDAALQLLALLQRDARLIDFVGEDLGAFEDAQIGAAARLVHQGCAKVLREHFSIEPVRPEAEGSRITLPAGFDAAAVRITGNVVGQPPYAGSLSHRGWRVTEVRLPKLAERHDARVIAPAEVEL